VITRTVLTLLLCGLLSFFVFLVLRGDVDDWGWLYFLLGIPVGLVVAWLTRSVELPRRVATIAACLLLFTGLGILVWGYLGLTMGRDPITGRSYEELDGLLALGLMAVSSVPATFGLLLLAMRSHGN